MASTAEFIRHGFHAASISTILSEADRNLRMFHHHFANTPDPQHALHQADPFPPARRQGKGQFRAAPPAIAVADLVRLAFDCMLEHPDCQGPMRIKNITNRHTMSVVLGCDLADANFSAARRPEIVAILRASLGHTNP